MALINRISRLFRADLHAVLDQIEEPELLLRQAVRDMEAEVATLERRIAEAAADQADCEARAVEIRSSLAHSAEELDLCFAAGNDDLARSLIRRKLESERLLKHAEREAAASEAGRADMARRLKDQQATLEGLRQKADVLGRRRGSAAGDAGPFRDLCIGDDEVEIAFLREQAQRSRS